MSEDTLEDRIDRLYARPLGDFTSSRNELAKELRSSGHRDSADRVKSLRKPSLTAWAINQIVHHYPEVFEATVVATARIRDAHAKGPDGLTEVMQVRKDAIAAAVEEASGVLTRADHPPGPASIRRLTGTIEALSSGSAEAVPGRVTVDLEPPGFGGLAGLRFAEPAVEPSRTTKKPAGQAARARKAEVGRTAGRPAPQKLPAAPAERTRRAAEKARLDRAAAALEKARSKLSRTELDTAAAEKDVRRAEKQLSDAQAASAAAETALTEALRRSKETAAEEEKLASRLERLRSNLVSRGAAAQSARTAVEEARAHLTRLETD